MMRSMTRARGREIRIRLLTALVSIVFVSAAALSAVEAAAGSEAPAAIQVAPDAPTQGDTLTVMISAAGQSRAAVAFDGVPVTVFEAPGGFSRAIIGTDPDLAPGVHTITVALTRPASGGASVQHAVRTVRLLPGHFAVRSLTMPPQTFALINPKNLAIERQALQSVLVRRTPAALWRGPFRAPSTGEMSTPYGEANVYNGHREWWHQGVDYAGPVGAPVTAAGAGVVVLSRALPLGGNTVVIDHGQGVLSEFLHLSAITVAVGDRVEQGGLIGRIGATGLATGPNVHWGLYAAGRWVNPLFWMQPRPGLTL